MKIPAPRQAVQWCLRLCCAAAASVLLAGTALAQTPAAKPGAKQAALDKALDAAMTPGEGQKRLDPMIGTFTVRMLTWVHPSKPPIESTASAVSVWVLGNRYVQTMLSGGDKDAFAGIGYVAYDNVAKVYQSAWMDNGSTGMTWYSGRLDAEGKSAVMKATTLDPVTGKPSPLEMRVVFKPGGGHATELWGQGLDSKMFKMMELQYTRVAK